MSLKSRSNQITQQIGLINGYCVNNKYQKVIGMRSLSNQAVNYHSELKLVGKNHLADIEFVTVECHCHKITGVGAGDVCKGSEHTVCRHCASAFVWSNQQKGKRVNLFDNFSDAFRYSNFGGQLVKLVSGNGEGWAVVSQRYGEYQGIPLEWTLDQIGNEMQSRLEKNTNLLHGEVEEGIY